MSTAIHPVSSDAAPGSIHLSVSQGVAWITLDNRAKLNAMSIAMWRQLVAALAGFEQDSAVQCVVIAGQGGKAFCVGADIDEKSGVEGTTGDEYNTLVIEALKTVQTFAKPTIAMISGYCLGGGVALAIACDLRVADAGARFGIPAARLGLACFYCIVERLSHLVGPSTAKHMLFTASRYSAQDAVRFGLVDEVAADSELHDTVRALATGIAANAPLTVAAAKRAVETAISGAAEGDLAACAELERACIDSEDYIEGRRAFREKRAPVFNGR